MDARAAFFLNLLDRRTARPGREWFAGAAAGLQGAFDRGVFLDAFAAAARQLGKAPLDLQPDEIARLRALGMEWSVSGWGLDELARALLLLLAASHLPEADYVALVEDCYRRGDNRERQAILRALPLLPQPQRFLPLGVDACRSHVQPVFEAIACENLYAAAHFPDLNFNQMVLKCLFTGVALDRVVGLDGRLTPELARMAADYARERKAAGRSVPVDIGRLMIAST